MTLTKTMKTKLLLGILAAATSLTLVVGGTLMFFTAESGPATNTVTLGSAAIQLEEYYPKYAVEENDGYAVVGNEYGEDSDIFDGIDFGSTIVPGDILDKRPRVANTGTVPVFVYVEGKLTVKDASGEAVDLSATEDSEAASQVASILASVNAEALGEDWKGTETAFADDGTLSGIWYYADDEGFIALEPGTATSDIFSTVEIPAEVDNTLAGYSLSIELYAYAVQSDNNDGATLTSLIEQF